MTPQLTLILAATSVALALASTMAIFGSGAAARRTR